MAGRLFRAIIGARGRAESLIDREGRLGKLVNADVVVVREKEGVCHWCAWGMKARRDAERCWRGGFFERHRLKRASRIANRSRGVSQEVGDCRR